jgi:drug/metabolite transporter (DMT)-like permease
MAVLCSSAVAVLLRLSAGPGRRKVPVITVNYLTAVVLSVFLQGRNLAVSFSTLLSPHEGLSGWNRASAPIMGIPLGVVFLLAFLVYRVALRESGLGLAGGFAKMGILLPMALSMAFWREFPGALQWVGIGAAVTGAALGAFRGGGGRFSPFLLPVFLLNGLAEFGSKVFQRYGDSGRKDFFLMWVFLTAFLCSLPLLLRERGGRCRGSVLLGIPLGLANYFSSWFLIPALDSVNTSVVFSVFGAGTVALLTLAGYVGFGEKPGGRETAVLILVAFSLVLVNL